LNTSLLRRLGYGAAAPVLAGVIALLISSIVLAVSGSDPIETYRIMLTNGSKLETWIDTMNRATPLLLAGIAAAIGFRMNLFNIGVEGQYRLAAFVAAVVGAEIALPGVLHVGVIVLIAMFVGALWAGLSAILYVTRGINEVISTIMLNFVATGGIIAGLQPLVIDDPTAANQSTPPLPESGWIPDLNGVVEIVTREIGKGRRLTGVFLLALVAAVVYHIVITRTRFGFDLRASGMNPLAARVGGVPPKKMVIYSMLGSGAVAGLVGMPDILSNTHAFDQGFTKGLGFAGITVALLGRNSAPGMLVAALLFGFLDSSSAILQVSGAASREIVVIMQATFLMVAVIAYEIVNHKRQQDDVARAAGMTVVAS